MSKRFIITLGTLLVIGLAAGIAVFLAKGYTISPSEKRIVGTGIISVTSTPDAAQVFLDGHLTTATNATIPNLAPKQYTIKVVKEGFIPWEKKVDVKEGLVNGLKLTLFPAIPTIYPLSFTGVANPTLSPDGSKLAYIVPSATASGGVNKKGGVWVWTMTRNQPIAFARSAEPHQIAQSGTIDYSKATLRWSANSKQILAGVGDNNYLLTDDTLNADPRDITPVLQSTLNSWDEDTKDKEKTRILALKNLDTKKIASESAIVKWSPDETKFLYKPKDDKSGVGFKIYDVETKDTYVLPESKSRFWLQDSLHIVLVDEDKVSVVDFDGTNQAVIYAGKFEDSLVFAWPDSSRLVFISSLPTPTASEPNLYGINLR